MARPHLLYAPRHLSSSERTTVLAARTRAVRDQLAHYRTMRDLAISHGARWGALATGELIRRAGIVLALIAVGTGAALALPAVPNSALSRG